MKSHIVVDASFLAEEQARAAQRRARFEQEAARPPPIPVPKRIAWPGGKIVTSDKREKLLSLLARQSSPPSAAQLRALHELSQQRTTSPISTSSDDTTEEASAARPNNNSMNSCGDNRTEVVRAAKARASTLRRRKRRLWPQLLTPWARRLSTKRAFLGGKRDRRARAARTQAGGTAR
jgi:hypothetical protein